MEAKEIVKHHAAGELSQSFLMWENLVVNIRWLLHHKRQYTLEGNKTRIKIPKCSEKCIAKYGVTVQTFSKPANQGSSSRGSIFPRGKLAQHSRNTENSLDFKYIQVASLRSYRSLL